MGYTKVNWQSLQYSFSEQLIPVLNNWTRSKLLFMRNVNIENTQNLTSKVR